MGYTKHGWIRESDNVYTEGTYYKKNRSLMITSNSKSGWDVWLRNTFTGEQENVGNFKTKPAARKAAQNYMKLHEVI